MFGGICGNEKGKGFLEKRVRDREMVGMFLEVSKSNTKDGNLARNGKM